MKSLIQAKKSTEEKVLEIFDSVRKATVKDVFDQFEIRGWDTAKTNSINTTLSRLTNTGILKQAGKSSEGTTIWERTELRTPLDDNRLSEKEITKSIDTIRQTLATIANIVEREGANFKLDHSLLRDYSKQLSRVNEFFEGYTDRTNEDEYKRRVNLGL